jgi:hypothetical protein
MILSGDRRIFQHYGADGYKVSKSQDQEFEALLLFDGFYNLHNLLTERCDTHT